MNRARWMIVCTGRSVWDVLLCFLACELSRVFSPKDSGLTLLWYRLFYVILVVRAAVVCHRQRKSGKQGDKPAFENV